MTTKQYKKKIIALFKSGLSKSGKVTKKQWNEMATIVSQEAKFCGENTVEIDKAIGFPPDEPFEDD